MFGRNISRNYADFAKLLAAEITNMHYKRFCRFWLFAVEITNSNCLFIFGIKLIGIIKIYLY